jgi:hypothetical protein
MDSKQVIELLAGAMGISCRGKDGCRVVCVLRWEDVQAISSVIQDRDEQLRDATKKINRLQFMLERAIYELVDNALVNCPPDAWIDWSPDGKGQLCDDCPLTPELCRSCWRKYFESEVADEDTDDCG